MKNVGHGSRGRLVAPAAVFIALSLCAFAPQVNAAEPAVPAKHPVLHVDGLHCGIFRIEGKRTRVTDLREPAGFRTVLKPGATVTFIKATRRIPAKAGTVFGCTYRLHGLIPGQRATLYKRYVHPLMVDRTGRRTTTFTVSETGFPRTADIPEAILYTLRQNFELVSGRWILSVVSDGKTLFAEKFETYKP